MKGSHTAIGEGRDAATRLHARTEELNAIFELSPDGFVAFDTAGLVRIASPAFFAMTGLAEKNVIGATREQFEQLLGDACLEQEAFPGFAALREMQSGRERRQPAGGIVGKPGGKPGGKSGGRPGGDRQCKIEIAELPRRVLEVGIKSAKGGTIAEILYFRDVTREAEVDQMKSDFIATAAHELRTPMASIYGFAELLATAEFDEDESHEFHLAILRQSDAMVSIISELLDLARIEARRGQDFKLEELDARTLAAEAIAAFQPPEGRRPASLSGGDLPLWVRVDRKKLKQAIGNVLANAYKYSAKGSAVRVELLGPTEEETPGELAVRISDQGIGMTPDQVSRVFERFYRADTSGKTPGTGLGMSIVKEIIELHGGTVDIASAPSAGTTVTLWLPARTKLPVAPVNAITET